MEDAIKEYTDSFKAHVLALKDEMRIKQKIRSTYYRLMRAKDEMKAKEKELLEDNEKYNE